MLRKVPEITLVFWVIKLLTTAAGEAMSDFLVYDINRYLAVVLGFVGLLVSLVLQLFVRKYIAWIYWLAVLMVAVFGTMAADVLHIVFGVTYAASTAFFGLSLAVIFVLWYLTERTLSIHSIFTSRREFFYWATVIATFALGTAAGDLTAFTLGLGFFVSVCLFGVLFAVPALAYRMGVNEVATFWAAYVVTRPLGASFADWVGRGPAVGGLGFGLGRTTAVLVALIVVFVGYLTITRSDVSTRSDASVGEREPLTERTG